MSRGGRAARDMEGLQERIAARARACPAEPEADIAADMLDEVDAETRELLTQRFIEGWCWKTRREDARAVEQAAQRERAADAQRERAERDAERERLADPDLRFATLYADPAVMYGERGTGPAVWARLTNRRERQAFERWCGSAAFEDWYVRALGWVEVNAPDVLDIFHGDWHPEGPSGHARDQLAARMARFVDDYAREIRLEFTAELLASEFALGDGRRVTWGSATVGEHEQRIALLTANATANAEAAARHRSAVSTLQFTGFDRLDEMPELQAETKGTIMMAPKGES